MPAWLGHEAIKRALEKHGYPITGEDVYEEMKGITHFDTGGLQPPDFGWGETKRLATMGDRLIQIKDGKIVALTPAGEWLYTPDEVIETSPWLIGE